MPTAERASDGTHLQPFEVPSYKFTDRLVCLQSMLQCMQTMTVHFEQRCAPPPPRVQCFCHRGSCRTWWWYQGSNTTVSDATGVPSAVLTRRRSLRHAERASRISGRRRGRNVTPTTLLCTAGWVHHRCFWLAHAGRSRLGSRRGRAADAGRGQLS